MAEVEYALERRARLMGQKLRQRLRVVKGVVAPEGERPLFHEAKSKSEALGWWRANRHSKHGEKILATWRPEDVASLDVALAQQIESDSLLGDPPGVA